MFQTDSLGCWRGDAASEALHIVKNVQGCQLVKSIKRGSLGLMCEAVSQTGAEVRKPSACQCASVAGTSLSPEGWHYRNYWSSRDCQRSCQHMPCSAAVGLRCCFQIRCLCSLCRSMFCSYILECWKVLKSRPDPQKVPALSQKWGGKPQKCWCEIAPGFFSHLKITSSNVINMTDYACYVVRLTLTYIT